MSLRTCSGFLGPAIGSLALALPGLAAAQSFQLPDLLPNTNRAQAWGVSGDGGVVSGFSMLSGGNYGPGWQWTPQGGMQPLVGGGFQPNSRSYGISGDGNVLVGETGPSTYDSPATAYRYNRATGQVQTLGVQPGYARSRGMAASLDGSVVVGKSFQSESSNFAQAFRWTEAGGLQPLGFTQPGLHNHSEARAVSAGGLTVVGDSEGLSGSEAFAWTANTGMVALPFLSGGQTLNRAYAITSDANRIVGYSGIHAAMWTNGSVIDLGVAPGYARSIARSISDDGAIIVGQISNGGPSTNTAAIWLQRSGWQPLAPYLAGIGVTIPGGVNLLEATGISRDGRTIIGYTSVSGNTQQAWVATIPAPGFLAPAGPFILFSMRRRRSAMSAQAVSGGQSRARRCRGGLALAALPFLSSAALAQSFQLLGLPPGTGGSYASGVSYDGSVAAGNSFFTGSGNYGPGWFWTPQDGRHDLVGPGFQPNSNAYGISGSGEYVVGETGPSQYDTPATAYRYNRATGQVQTLGVQPGYARSRGMAASLDGSVVVGKSFQSESSNFAQAFRWTEAGGLQPLGFTQPGLHNHSEATAVSANGELAVGYSEGLSGSDAFVWTLTDGMTSLPHLPGSIEPSTRALGMNSSGTVIVGSSGTQQTAVLWQNGSIVSLGTAPGFARSYASGVSESATVIVGNLNSGSLSSHRAGIWFPETGWQPLEQYLTTIGVILPTGLHLYDATGISDDGRIIVGYTAVSGSIQQAFVVTIPAPSALMLLAPILALSMRRRRSDGAESTH